MRRWLTLTFCLLLASIDCIAIDRESFRFRYRESKEALFRSNRLKEIGAVLILKRGGVPGRSNRRIDAGIWEGNINRYAEVQVRDLQAEPRSAYDLELTRESVLVIVKVKFNRDNIELWTRTIDPFLVAHGHRLLSEELTYYGTKFKFFFPETTLAADNLSPVYNILDQWFDVFPNFSAAARHLAKQRGSWAQPHGPNLAGFGTR